MQLRRQIIIAVASCAIGVGVVAAYRDGPPAKKPLSVEDEIRELKRRAAKLETEREKLEKAVKETNEDLRQANEKIEAARDESKGKLKEVGQRAMLDRVPLGAMIPYFGAGDTPPKGYVFADGKTFWPDAPWLPGHLKGEKVPDMREHMVGGANDEASIGRVYSGGQITIKPFTVEGSRFGVPMKTARLPGGATYYFVWQNESGWEIGKPEETKPLPPWVEARVGGSAFWMRLTPVRAFVPTPSGSVSGTQSISGLKSEPMNSAATNPRHVMCRWIIRVE